MEDMHIYCLMHSGKSLTSSAREVLLENAQWMAFEGNHDWRVKRPLCEGYIKSDLKSIDYMGLEAVQFHALLDTPEGTTEVDYLIRVSDLKNVCLPEMNWVKKVSPEVERAMSRAVKEQLAREGHDINDSEINEGIGFEIEGNLNGPLALCTSEEDNDRQDTPFSRN